MEEGASLVCSVVNTRWPVRDACTAILAVSRSRVSPMSTMSGSCRRKLRRAAAKVRPTAGLTCTCTRPSMSYSTGSSAVRIFSVISFNSERAEYSVVVLPEPVGPVTITMPLGLRMSCRKVSRSSSRMPTLARSSETLPRSRIRMTTDSPNMVGSTATRRSTGSSPTVSSMRPSWGTRRSAMSMLAMTFTRETIGIARCLGGGIIS